MKHDVLLDVCGERCPKPILEARKKLKRMANGQVLKVIATDPLAEADFQIFCKTKQHVLLNSSKELERYIFHIQK
jgi:tRNA 2-thiouridine synthesizing protein A